MVLAGKNAESSGGMYHPAANAKLDELTQGLSSLRQVEALLKNIELAEKFIEKYSNSAC